MRALITGGLGFIGSHLAVRCLAEGHQVALLDSLIPQVHPGGEAAWIPTGAEVHRADVCEREPLESLVRAADVVFHLAAETGTGQSMREVERYVRTNVGGTARLIEAVLDSGSPPRVVLASSRAVYGEGAGTCPLCGPVAPLRPRQAEAMHVGRWSAGCPECGTDCLPRATPEGCPPCPASVYGVTKHAQEELLRTSAAAGSLNCCALRFQNVYGPGQSLSNPYTGLLTAFYGRLGRGLRCELFEDGRPLRDFLYVSDAVDALMRAAQLEIKGFAAINIGSGEALPICEIEAMLRSIVRRPDLEPEVSGHFRSGDIRDAWADVARAQELLGWRPRVGLRAGLLEFVLWAEGALVPHGRNTP